MNAVATSPGLEDNPLCSDWFALPQDGRVLLKTAKVEIGQGITTALVQIAADEFDVAPDRFDVLSGHTRLGPLEAGTSSSLSMETTGRAIRMAASAMRHVLLAEAGTLLQADSAGLDIRNGVIFQGSRGTSLTIWEVAQTADFDIPVVSAANTGPARDRYFVGSDLPRRDLRDKAAGRDAFIQDLVLDGMRHGRVLQPPAPGRVLVAFDRAGLEAVCPEVSIVVDGSFAGVIAKREADAVRAIEHAAALATWSPPGIAPADVIAALDGDDVPEIVVRDDMAETEPKEAGRDESVAGRSFEMRITKPFLAHGSIAPSCAVAVWHDGRLEVHSHTQSPHGLRDGLAIVFGLDALRDVTVIHTPGAGTYGHNGQDDAALDAALLAKTVPGVPVRVIWSRADEFTAAPLGPAMVVRAAAVLAPSGTVASFAITSCSQPHARRPGRHGFAELTAAARIDPPCPITVPDDVATERGGGADRNATPLYAFPGMRISKRIVKTLPYRTSALRSLGGFANIMAIEALMDDMAEAAGQDALTFRLAHLDDPRARAVLERAAAMAGWPGPTGEGEAIGLGVCQYKNRSAYTAVAMRIRLDRDVELVEAWAACDAGEIVNPTGVRSQIEGSIVQAASWTLKEAIALEEDQVVTRSWDDYPILRFAEIPPMTVDLIDHPEKPWLGVGETAVGPTGAAIGNAVKRAIGVRVCDLPITREAIESVIGR